MIVTNPFTPGTWTRQEIDNVSRGWWILLATGILSPVTGGIIVLVDWTVGDLAVFVGAVLLFRGLATAFSVPLDGAALSFEIKATSSRADRLAGGIDDTTSSRAFGTAAG
jgi:hypothetical protein